MLMHQGNSGSQAGDQSYRHLLQHLPICIFVVDLTVTPAIILEVNRRIETVYGYKAVELIGNPAAQLVAEESKVDIKNIFQRVQQGQMVTAEIISRHRDGTAFPIRMIATLDPADIGRTIMVVEDITAERQHRSEAEAIDAERLRIAHEIHDGVAQSLAGLRFKLALWSQLADQTLPGMRTALEEVQAALVTAITDLRRAIFALRPLDLETLGFLPALNQFVTNFGDQNQLSARLEVSGHPTNLLMIYELPLFRIIQESLNNIHQHANASSVLVRIMVDIRGGVVATIRDNGRGFDPNLVGMPSHSRQFGLRQMRERIQDLGGTLDICSAVGHGAELLITLPPINKEVNYGIDSHSNRR
jgi:PAS domain S-box-containing protein